MKMIMAQCGNGIIGCGNTECNSCNKGLPWRCNSELKLFKEKTEHKTIIMGWNTYKAMGILSNRLHIVISKDLTIAGKEQLVQCKELMKKKSQLIFVNDRLDWNMDELKNAWVIGGKRTYELLSEYITEYHISTINDQLLIPGCTDPVLSPRIPYEDLEYLYQINRVDFTHRVYKTRN